MALMHILVLALATFHIMKRSCIGYLLKQHVGCAGQSCGADRSPGSPETVWDSPFACAYRGCQDRCFPRDVTKLVLVHLSCPGSAPQVRRELSESCLNIWLRAPAAVRSHSHPRHRQSHLLQLNQLGCIRKSNGKKICSTALIKSLLSYNSVFSLSKHKGRSENYCSR